MFGRKTAVVPNGYDATLTDNALYGSKVINGNLAAVYTVRGMFPSQAAAPYWYGNGSKPATLAGFSPSQGVSAPALSMATGVGGGAMDDGDPWSFRSSPTVWAIVFLIIGFVGLRHIHWRAE